MIQVPWCDCFSTTYKVQFPVTLQWRDRHSYLLSKDGCKHSSGTYILHDGRDPVYVGKSEHIGNRVHSHLSRSYDAENPVVYRWRIALDEARAVATDGYIVLYLGGNNMMFEVILISLLRPRCNKDLFEWHKKGPCRICGNDVGLVEPRLIIPEALAKQAA